LKDPYFFPLVSEKISDAFSFCPNRCESTLEDPSGSGITVVRAKKLPFWLLFGNRVTWKVVYWQKKIPQKVPSRPKAIFLLSDGFCGRKLFEY